MKEVYLVGAFSHFDMEIKELIGVFTTEEKAKQGKEEAIKRLDKEDYEEIVFYIRKVEVDQLLKSYLIEKEW